MPKAKAATEVVKVVTKTEDTPPQQSENEKSVDAPKKEKVRRSTRISKKRALLKLDPKAPPKSGAVLYIGHIPHGFYEEQMRGFFSQFGEITRVRLSRSIKTGKSKHYAFVEFQFPQVAVIAAEAMNNYLMNGKILKVHVMPDEDLHDKMMIGSNRKFTKVPRGKVEREKRDQERTEDQKKERMSKLLKRDDTRRKKISEAGIEYDFAGYEATIPEKCSHKKF